MYTVLHMFRQVLFGAGNQSNHQNLEKSLLSCKCRQIFIGVKQKKFIFLKNKIQNGQLKKHQCDSTYMAVRLSDVSSKKG